MNGIKTIIVAPHTIPVPPGQFVKTDVIDSRKLASELSKGSLRGIFLRATDNLFDRGLLRKRSQLGQTTRSASASDCIRPSVLWA